jgi:hypothetical protein
MLSGCFGEKMQSGYKLNSCTGIAIDDSLYWSQIVDGYKKLVNGILALTFVKRVYAERILNRKVNWAQYASAKLHGQILQWEREKKVKPDGPLYVEKPRLYRPPRPLVVASTSREIPVLTSTPTSTPTSSFRGPRAGTSSSLSLERSNNSSMAGLRSELEHSSILLQVLRSCILTINARKAKIVKDAEKIKLGLEVLESAELDQPKLVANLSKECRTNEADIQSIKIQHC